MMQTQTDPYLVAWANLRRRRLLFLGSLAVTPIVFVIAGAFNEIVRLVLSFAPMSGSMHWLALFVCPRCGERLTGPRFNINFSPKGCESCGLKVGTSKVAAQASLPPLSRQKL